MTRYWLKIGLGAVAIFVAGMVVIAIARAVIASVRRVAETGEPISVPLAFLPFRFDGEQLGTFERLVLRRKSPHEVSAVELRVKLADTAAAERLPDCPLVADFGPGPPGHRPITNANFTCARGDSTAGLEQFGQVSFRPGDRTVVLFLPADIAMRIRHETIDVRPEPGTDSAAEPASRMADSIAALAEQRADSISRTVLRRADSVRQRARRLRDAARAARDRM
jgi:hypothetical protein